MIANRWHRLGCRVVAALVAAAAGVDAQSMRVDSDGGVIGIQTGPAARSPDGVTVYVDTTLSPVASEVRSTPSSPFIHGRLKHPGLAVARVPLTLVPLTANNLPHIAQLVVTFRQLTASYEADIAPLRVVLPTVTGMPGMQRNSVIGRSATGVQGVSFLILFPLTFLSNIFVPVDTMPGWLRWFAGVNPVSHVATVARDLSNTGSSGMELLWALLGAVVVVGVFAPLTVRAYMRRA